MSTRAICTSCLVIALVAVAGPASAQDLILTNTSVTLGGTLTYDNVVLTNSTIHVATYDPANPSNTGLLHIIADSITVDSNSLIDGRWDGYQQTGEIGDGPGGGEGGIYVIDGGGGGGHGGLGGDGARDWWQPGAWPYNTCGTPFPDGNGGFYYGTTDGYDIDMGSAGGAGGSGDNPNDATIGGGAGGAAVWLEADTLAINGTINVRGGNASTVANDSGGGGAGGGIMMIGYSVQVGGVLNVRGGNGHYYDDGGGGGSGGRIKIFYGVDNGISPSVNINGGNRGWGSCGPSTEGAWNGDVGTYAEVSADADGDGYLDEEFGYDDCDDSSLQWCPVKWCMSPWASRGLRG